MALSILLSLVAPPASAQEPEPGRSDGDRGAQAAEVPTVQVTVTVEGRASDLQSQTLEVIDRGAIEASGARTLGDLLRSMSSVNVLSTGSRSATAAQVRGGDANFTVVLLDGVPLNDSTDQLGGLANLEALNTSFIERVEIARGPVSFYVGSAALAGVINVVTRTGRTGPARTELHLEAGAGSLVQATVSTSGRSENRDYAVQAYLLREEERIAAERFRTADVSGNLGFGFGDDARLEVTSRFARGSESDYSEASGGPLLGSGELRTSDRRVFDVSGDLDLGRPRGMRHRVKAFYYRRELDRWTPAIATAVPPIAEETVYDHAHLSWAGTPLTRGSFVVNLGAHVDHEEGTNVSRLELPVSLGGDVSGNYQISRTIPAVLTEVSFERSRVLVEGGLRLDVPGPPSGVVWSPRLGMNLRPGSGPTRIHASVSRGFKMPSFFALASPRALGGNPSLKPETSLGADLGVTTERAASGLRGGLTGFYVRYQNLVDFDFDSFLHVNRADVSSYGIEMSFGWTPRPFVSVHGEVTWNVVRDLTSGSPLLHRPRWIGSARIEWRPQRNVRAWLDVRTVSASLDRQIPVPDRDRVDGYGLLGLSAMWEPTARWSVRGRLDNLTDRRYETFIGFPGAGIGGRIAVGFTFGERAKAP